MVNIFENPAYYPVHHINTWTYYHCVPYAYTGENKLHFTKDDFKTLTREFAKLNELLLPASEVTFSVPIGEGINYYLYTHNSYFKQKKVDDAVLCICYSEVLFYSYKLCTISRPEGIMLQTSIIIVF